MQSAAKSVDEYLQQLPESRRDFVSAIRNTIRSHLQPGFAEGMQYGMIGYFVPHHLHPAGYHGDPREPVPFVGLASQKNYVSLYLFCIYTSPELMVWFREAWQATGKRLDIGKSCLRLRKLEDVPMDLIGETISRVSVKEFLTHYQQALESRPGQSSKSTKAR